MADCWYNFFVNIVKAQVFPIFLTFITFIFISLFLILFVRLLNLVPLPDKILVELRPRDILVGLTIYLKVSIDFAIFMGNLIKNNPGWKNRVSIELGTSLGNAIGTVLILTIWFFFKSVDFLLAIMIIVASLVLLKMAQEGIEDFLEIYQTHVLSRPIARVGAILAAVNRLTYPVLSKIIPEGKLLGKGGMTFFRLLGFSLTVPFILGLDDFAGYIPLFSIVNVVSFSIGVFLAHMILTASIFISPKRTVQIVEKPIIILLGSSAFIIIAIYGFYEVVKILIR